MFFFFSEIQTKYVSTLSPGQNAEVFNVKLFGIESNRLDLRGQLNSPHEFTSAGSVRFSKTYWVTKHFKR
jgi:hypothetical protein